MSLTCEKHKLIVLTIGSGRNACNDRMRVCTSALRAEASRPPYGPPFMSSILANYWLNCGAVIPQGITDLGKSRFSQFICFVTNWVAVKAPEITIPAFYMNS